MALQKIALILALSTLSLAAAAEYKEVCPRPLPSNLVKFDEALLEGLWYVDMQTEPKQRVALEIASFNNTIIQGDGGKKYLKEVLTIKDPKKANVNVERSLFINKQANNGLIMGKNLVENKVPLQHEKIILDVSENEYVLIYGCNDYNMDGNNIVRAGMVLTRNIYGLSTSVRERLIAKFNEKVGKLEDMPHWVTRNNYNYKKVCPRPLPSNLMKIDEALLEGVWYVDMQTEPKQRVATKCAKYNNTLIRNSDGRVKLQEILSIYYPNKNDTHVKRPLVVDKRNDTNGLILSANLKENGSKRYLYHEKVILDASANEYVLIYGCNNYYKEDNDIFRAGMVLSRSIGGLSTQVREQLKQKFNEIVGNIETLPVWVTRDNNTKQCPCKDFACIMQLMIHSISTGLTPNSQ